MKRIALGLGIVGMLAYLTACGSQAGTTESTQAPASGAAAQNADGKLIYKNYCLTCHGGNLEGGRGPNLQQVGERLDADMIANKVLKGGGGMPAFKVSLKKEDIQAVAEWLATIK